MDDKDLEIANLQGQVEAYQDQLRSVSIDLLRMQVQQLRKGEQARELLVIKNQQAFGKFSTQVNDRLDKASSSFREMQGQMNEMRAQMSEDDPEKEVQANVDAD